MKGILKHFFRYFVLSVLIVSVSMFSAGCSEGEGEQQTLSEETDNKPKIGMSFDSFVTERWIRDQETFVSTAKELGADVNVQSANGDVNEQIAQLEYFIEKKMDVIVIIAADASSLQDVIAKAKGEGIRVICYDRLCLDSNADLYISFDNEQVGALMGEALLGGASQKNVLMVCGPEADFNVTCVEKGFKSACRKYGANIIGSCNCDGWRSEEAYDYINNNIDLVEQADAIMCGNDDLASAVTTALSENRLLENVKVVGQDADLAACQRIVEGKQLMTVYKPVEKLARNAAECAVKMANGESLEVDETFSDGTYEVPYIRLEPIAVTKANMDEEIVSSGFHLKEEIYIGKTTN